MKLKIVLHNIRSTYNVGAILRTAEGLGVERVIFSGYTPRYDDPELLPHLRKKLNRQIAKSALGAEEMVARENVDDLPSWLAEEKVQGGLVMGLENNLAPEEIKRRIMLGASDWLEEQMVSQQAPPEQLILILGEEVEGIPSKIRQECDYFLEIPMQGRKESFNVSVAAAIAMWEILKPRDDEIEQEKTH